MRQHVIAAVLSALAASPVGAQDLSRVCVSWGGPEDGTEVVLYTPDNQVEIRSVSWLDEPERGVRRLWGKAPEGAWDRLAAELPTRLATLAPDPSADSCDAGSWRWRIAAEFDDGGASYAEGACFDGPTELLYREMAQWTDLFTAIHFGAEWQDGPPATPADHRACAAPGG